MLNYQHGARKPLLQLCTRPGVMSTIFGRARISSVSTSAPKKPKSRVKLIALGIGIYGLSAYGFWFYNAILDPDTSVSGYGESLLLPGEDVSARYDVTASSFDKEVGLTETTSGLGRLRKRLIKAAKGHVLETSVGTGRNFDYYDLKQCESLTFVDQSGPMIDVAVEKWRKLHPRPIRNCPITFRKQSALDAISMPVAVDGGALEGFDTIIQTMGVCSTPNPAETLAYLATLLKPETGRLLLLEHGRGKYDWINAILDKNAPRHACKFGCWYNRDIQKILDNSGIEIIKAERPYWRNLGTVWLIEARRKTKIST